MDIIISQEERERAILRSRRMYQSDFESNFYTAKREGRAEGREERGLEIARSMLARAMSPELISEITGLTIVEIETLATSAQQ